MADSVQYGSLPFQEQIDFFRGKVNLPTQSWTDLWEGQHARGFVIAGATQDALLTDLRRAIDKAIADGTTLQQFRKDFDGAVAKHGWAYNGGRNWRTRVIYETNVRQSYNAGRYAQMKEEAKHRPYWRYNHDDTVDHPRPQHQAWDGMVLHHDDPWWSSHYPMNGWGCKCSVDSLSERDMKRLGKSGPDKAPAVQMREVVVGKNGPNPRTVSVPVGVDPGFGYSVGEAAHGKQLSEEVMEGWRKMKNEAWDRQTPGSWETYQRPKIVPKDSTTRRLAPKVQTVEELHRTITAAMGQEEKVFTHGKSAVLVNAETLSNHLKDNLWRAPYIPFLLDVLENPFEIWMGFERHKGTGLVVLRQRWIKIVDIPKKPAMVFVAQVRAGTLESYTFIPDEARYIEKQREGKLVWGRK